MAKVVDLTGKIIGFWSVIQRGENTASGKATWLCICKCGTKRNVVGSSLIKKVSLSCGCRQPEIVSKFNTTHGMTGTTEYSSWQMMMSRCYNKNLPDYYRYGGAGITVCKRWHDPANFFKDMGLKPEGKNSIDRIDGTKNYEPSNCRWADQYEQMNNVNKNRYIDIDGDVMTVANAARYLGIKYKKLLHQLNNGQLAEVFK